jgi:hypothetical protein
MLGSARTAFSARAWAPTESRTARTITVVGDAAVSTAQSKFGGASLLNAIDGYLEVTQDAVFDFGTSQDFTIEMFGRLNTTITGKYFFDGRADAASVAILMDSNFLKVYIDGSYRISTSADPFAADTWVHVAYTRSGTTGTLWLDGVSQGTWTDNVDYTFSNELYLGSRFSGEGGDAYFDEIRISNVARYTAGFTPTTSEFVNDANTLLLLHCNGTNGSTTFLDDNS